jgi:hypothetical protein
MSREPSLATLKALAEAAVRYVGPNGERMGSNDGAELAAYVSAYRAEITPPLRTRAEVDAAIVSEIREWFHNSGNYPVGLADHTRANLLALCREPTAPEPERCPQCLCVGHHQKPCHPDRSPVGSSAAVCPCDASQRLHGYLRDLREIYNEECAQGRDSVALGRIAGVIGRYLGGHP